jgi:hypothetical protein
VHASTISPLQARVAILARGRHVGRANMNATTLKSWLGQVTTGIGALIGLPVVMALLTGQVTMAQAMPGIVAAVIGLIWPENKQLAGSAQTLVADAEVFVPQLMSAYRTGLQHGAAAVAPPVPLPVVAAAVDTKPATT